MPFAMPGAPMSQKRKQTDDPGDEAGGSALRWEAPNNQHYDPPAFGSSTHAIAQPQYAPATGGSGGSAGASTTMGEPSGPNNPYPDVSSYSQPYFYQQTHPSAYNSPWPPSDAPTFGSHTNTYPQPSSMSAAATDMPFFPSQPPAETVEPSFNDVQQQQLVPTFSQDGVNATTFAYASRNEHGLARSDVPAESSAFLYEDASMHLKIQSLPILENLVRICSLRRSILIIAASVNSIAGHPTYPHYSES